MANSYYTHTALVEYSSIDVADINNISSGIESGFDLLPTPVQFQNGTSDLASVGGTANAIVLTRDFPTAALINGTEAEFFATATNTGATTVNLDSKGVKALTTKALAALTGGEIVSGGWYKIKYDGTQFQLVE